MICETPTEVGINTDELFRYAQYCPSTTVNSGWLKTAIQEAIAQAGEAPVRIRFFRRQMNNMITKACEDIGIPAQASRRTLLLNQWLQERMEQVYPQEPGYKGGSNPSVNLQAPLPQKLPDALEGQKWQFASLSAAEFGDMPEWEIGFGEGFPLDMVGVSEETPIPGVLIFSPRALPLAGWMSGLELAWLRFDNNQGAKLVLETGASESWILANLKNPQVLAAAKDFESAKQKANGVHFVAVQSNSEAESFAGFWLLCEVNLP